VLSTDHDDLRYLHLPIPLFLADYLDDTVPLLLLDRVEQQLGAGIFSHPERVVRALSGRSARAAC
jgi:hypothetical protein